MVYYRFCATCDGFVGFCGLLVVVATCRGSGRERVNINSKFFFSWGFTFGLVAVLWVVGCSGGGIGF